MERNDAQRGPDTGKIELKRILDCLKKNGYAYEDLEESNFNGFMIANFKKDIQYSDLEGNYINDRHIKIQIEFDSDFDYQTSYKDRDDEFLFDNDKGERFIKKLFHNNASSHSARTSNRTRSRSRSSGGTRKRTYKGKK